MLLKMVAEAMEKCRETTTPLNIVADFLEMDAKETPERQHYVNLLRKGVPRATDYLSIIDKFGQPRERKLSQMVRRKAIAHFGYGGKRKQRIIGWLQKTVAETDLDGRMWHVVMRELINVAQNT